MKIGIVGVGNMGYAFAKAMISREIISHGSLVLIDKNNERLKALSQEHLGEVSESFELLQDCNIVLLAVKPQMFSEVGEEIKPFLQEGQLIISIMAGVRIDKIAEVLGTSKVVRAMPNTPCMLGEGVTGFYLGNAVAPDQSKVIELILASTGKAIQVDSEDDIDSVTAVSGSGPAYFYLFASSMIEAGKSLGLDQVQAREFTLQTMKGAYQMLEKHEGPIQDLIDAVTSKGGTTQAALSSFHEDSFPKIVSKALYSAKKRAEELSENN